MKRLITSTAVFVALAAPAFTNDEQSAGAPIIGSDTREVSRDDDTMATGGMAASEPSMFSAPAPDIAREDYVSLEYDQLVADDLDGAEVYDTANQNIGEVDQLFLTDDGELHGVILEVGGFLGLAEKPVLVSMSSLSIQQSDNGDLAVYVDASRETLEAVKAYQF